MNAMLRSSALLVSLSLALPAAAASPDSRRPDAERRLVAATAPPAVAPVEAPVEAQPVLPALPASADEALARRLAVLGLDADLRAELLAEAPAALAGDAQALARIDELLVVVEASPEGAKARTVFETWLAGRPLGLLGFELELEDQLFLGELLRQGVEAETAGWLVLAGRAVGWPADLAERESLRASFASALSGQPELLESALDAGALRNQAPILLDPVEQDELLRPALPKDHLPGDQETVVCRA